MIVLTVLDIPSQPHPTAHLIIVSSSLSQEKSVAAHKQLPLSHGKMQHQPVIQKIGFQKSADASFDFIKNVLIEVFAQKFH